MKLVIKDLIKNYDETNVFDHLSFEATNKEVLAIFGESGSGLTSLGYILKGEEEITSGSILLDNEDIENKVSLLNKNTQLFSHLSLKDNYLSYLRNKDIPLEEKERRIEEVASKLQLSLHLSSKPAELTSGQYLRGVIGKGLLDLPKVLVLDDVLAKVNTLTRSRFWKEVKKIAKDFDIIVILLTHFAPEAFYSASKLAYLKYGKILTLESPLSIYKEPKTLDIALAFSFPPINVLKGEYLNNSLKINEVNLPLDPSFLLKHDSYYSKALASLNEDDELFLTYKEALNAPHTLLVGVKAENVIIQDDGEFEGEVNVIEKLPNKNLVHLTFLANEILCITLKEVAVGETLRFSIKNDDLLLFDPLTKNLIK